MDAIIRALAYATLAYWIRIYLGGLTDQDTILTRTIGGWIDPPRGRRPRHQCRGQVPARHMLVPRRHARGGSRSGRLPRKAWRQWRPQGSLSAPRGATDPRPARACAGSRNALGDLFTQEDRQAGACGGPSAPAIDLDLVELRRPSSISSTFRRTAISAKRSAAQRV